MKYPRRLSGDEAPPASDPAAPVSASHRRGMHEVIVACYPRAWRERYEGELTELLSRERWSPRVAFDLLRGALDAHLHPQFGERGPSRVRRAIGVALLAVALVAAGYVGQHPTTARTLDAFTASRPLHAGVATATLTEHGHSQRSVRPE